MTTQATKNRQQELLRQLRQDIGCDRLYESKYVRYRCEVAYGREISDRLWLMWRRSVRTQDDAIKDSFSEASYILLLTKAVLLRGNSASKGGKKKQVSIERLDQAVRAIISGERPWDVPSLISYADLKRLIELRALKTYTERYLRRKGLKRSQKLYSKAQAVQILSNFPNYSHVFQQNSESESSAQRTLKAA